MVERRRPLAGLSQEPLETRSGGWRQVLLACGATAMPPAKPDRSVGWRRVLLARGDVRRQAPLPRLAGTQSPSRRPRGLRRSHRRHRSRRSRRPRRARRPRRRTGTASSSGRDAASVSPFSRTSSFSPISLTSPFSPTTRPRRSPETRSRRRPDLAGLADDAALAALGRGGLLALPLEPALLLDGALAVSLSDCLLSLLVRAHEPRFRRRRARAAVGARPHLVTGTAARRSSPRGPWRPRLLRTRPSRPRTAT